MLTYTKRDMTVSNLQCFLHGWLVDRKASSHKNTTTFIRKGSLSEILVEENQGTIG